MSDNLVRSKRSLALLAAIALVGASALVLLSGGAAAPRAHAATAPGATVRASVANESNAEAADGARQQELSADGTAVTFTSYSRLDDLQPAEYENVFVRDLRRDRTVMISRGQLVRETDQSDESEPTFREVPPNNDSFDPTISADGRYVAFVTTANNIVSEDEDYDYDILVCDRDPDGDGEFDEQRANGGRDYRYFRVNEPRYGEESDYRYDFPHQPKLSDGAERIVWQDEYTEPDGRYGQEVRTAALTSALGGPVDAPLTTERLRPSVDGYTTNNTIDPDVSGNGRFVVFSADYTSSSLDESSEQDTYRAIIRYDTSSGAADRVDLDLAATPESPVYVSDDYSVAVTRPAVSFDGTVLAFEAERRGSEYQPNVYVARVDVDGTAIDSMIVSRDNKRAPINGVAPGLSGDGRFVAFVTDNLGAHDGIDVREGRGCLRGSGSEDGVAVAGRPILNLSGPPPADPARDNRTVCQVVVHDLVVDRQRLVDELPPVPGTLASPGEGGGCAATVPAGATCAGNADTTPRSASTAPSLSDDGDTVAYDSDATNLVPGEADGNEATDVFVRTFRPELRGEPDPLEFGAVELGDSFEQSVRFDHVGTGPLVVETVEVAGRDAADFPLGAQTCRDTVLQQTGSCLVALEFAPRATGDREATLRLTVRGDREFTVDLRGRGSEEPVDPDDPDVPGPNPGGTARFAAGPDPLAFGQRLLLSTGPEPAVTVTNRGDGDLVVRAVAVLSTVAPNDYAITTNTCVGSPVPAGGQCRVAVRFSPTAPGERAAVLSFTDNAVGGPHLVGLNGSGSTPGIEVSPGVSPPSRVITVTGTGFAPERDITVSMPGAQADPVSTDATGVFRATLLILPRSMIGTRVVTAAVTDFPSIKAEKPVLVVPPTVTPADFVVRG